MEDGKQENEEAKEYNRDRFWLVPRADGPQGDCQYDEPGELILDQQADWQPTRHALRLVSKSNEAYTKRLAPSFVPVDNGSDKAVDNGRRFIKGPSWPCYPFEKFLARWLERRRELRGVGGGAGIWLRLFLEVGVLGI